MELMHRSSLVAGGGSGIGQAIAVELARKQGRITLFGRRSCKLEETAALIAEVGGEAQIVAGDVREAQARERAVSAALDRFGEVDILVNSVGCVAAGRLERLPEDDIRQMIEVNLLGPMLLTRAALPALRRGGDAMIVNLSSAVALIGLAYYSTYSATKAGVALFSEALRRELYGEGVHVLTVYPNATRTPLMATANAGPELGFHYETPQAVAEAVIAGMEAGEVEVVRDKERRAQMLATNRERPAEVDARLARKKHVLEEAVTNHRAM